MSFEVQPAALRELAGLLDRAREDAEKIKQHLLKIKDFEGGEGVLNQIVGGHKAVHSSLDQWTGALAAPTLTTATQAVNDSATYYENTDAASAEKLDSTYPPTSVAEVRVAGGYRPLDMPDTYAPFGDITEPTAFLAEPKDYTTELDGSPSWWDVFSPMAQIGNAIESVSHVAVWMGWADHPYDPQAELVKPFVGDWAGVRAAADVLRDAGTAVYAMGNNIKWASQSTETVWQGNAGAGATVYLMDLSKPLDEFHGPMNTLAAAYETASGEMVTLRDVAVGVLNQIGDSAIQAAIACGFGAGAVSTGVGAPLGALAAIFAGYKINRVIDGIRTLMDVIGKLDMATKVLKASQTEFGDLQSAAKLPALPDRPMNVPSRERS